MYGVLRRADVVNQSGLGLSMVQQVAPASALEELGDVVLCQLVRRDILLFAVDVLLHDAYEQRDEVRNAAARMLPRLGVPLNLALVHEVLERAHLLERLQVLARVLRHRGLELGVRRQRHRA
jgi:hypothetical protein